MMPAADDPNNVERWLAVVRGARDISTAVAWLRPDSTDEIFHWSNLSLCPLSLHSLAISFYTAASRSRRWYVSMDDASTTNKN